MNKLILTTLTLTLGLIITGCEKKELPELEGVSNMKVSFRTGSPAQNLCNNQSAFINVTGDDVYRVPNDPWIDHSINFTTEPGLQTSKHTCGEFIFHVVSTYVDAAANNGAGQVKDSVEVGTVDENCLVNINNAGDYYGFRVYAISKYSPRADSAFAEVLCAP